MSNTYNSVKISFPFWFIVYFLNSGCSTQNAEKTKILLIFDAQHFCNYKFN